MANRSEDNNFSYFCGRHQDEVDQIIKGGAANICDECVMNCFDIIMANSDIALPESRSKKKKSTPRIKMLKPKEIKEELDKYVIGQERAKIALSVAV